MTYPIGSGSSNTLQRRPSLQVHLVLAGFLAGLAATGVAWWVTVGPQQTMSLYWLTSPDNDVYYVQQELSVRALGVEQAIAMGLSDLIHGSRDSRLISAIPADTEVLNVKVEGNDIFLDFSPEFTSGGGSTSMLGRITQVLYTATSRNEDAKLWITVEGKALTTLGGEGLILDQPLTRESFDPSFKNQVFFANVNEYQNFNENYANHTINLTPQQE